VGSQKLQLWVKWQPEAPNLKHPPPTLSHTHVCRVPLSKAVSVGSQQLQLWVSQSGETVLKRLSHPPLSHTHTCLQGPPVQGSVCRQPAAAAVGQVAAGGARQVWGVWVALGAVALAAQCRVQQHQPTSNDVARRCATAVGPLKSQLGSRDGVHTQGKVFMQGRRAPKAVLKVARDVCLCVAAAPAGDASVAFSPFQPNVSSSQPTLPFRVMQAAPDQPETEPGQVLELPQYRILPADAAGSSAAGESWSGLGPFER
jgi:hypothetical protein